MADLPPIAVVLTADTSDFTQGISKATRQIDSLDEPTKRTSKSLGLLKFAAVGAAAVVAAKQVYDFAASAVQSAEQAQVADARLRQVAESMGFVDGAYRGGVARLNEYSTALMKQIGVDDESIKMTQAKLLTFKEIGKTMNETGGIFDRATQAAYDLASAGFGSAEGNAIQLGKALNNPIKGINALTRAGITFTDSEKQRIQTLVESNKIGKAQELVLAAIEKQVGGVAEATVTSAQKAKIAYGEFQEAIGTALLPTVNKMFETLTPMFEKLSEPIARLAEQIANVLGKAFDAIAPVIPVLIDALVKLGGALGDILSGALSALIPAITPIVKAFGDLASSIGPVLTPILTKIGELFQEVVAAVMPLVPPLTKLVVDIFRQAGPIIGVVVDVLITLVRALTPVLGAVSTLIPPLGQLINVVFKAFMPIITPLIPVIESLASVLGDVLIRAIGVLTSAAGVWISGFAKIAPFILNNVAKPVAQYFLTMAENVLGAAEKMLGWIPGLGDKLATARASINTFKIEATKAISGAATTISTEGSKIGKGLIDQGVLMMTNPAQIARLQEAGYGAGAAMAFGMSTGIRNNTDTVYASAGVMLRAAARGAGDASKATLPSFEGLGAAQGEALAKGAKDSGESVRKKLQEAYVQWFDETVQSLKGKIEEAKDAFTSFKDDVTASIMQGIDFSAAAPKFDEQGNRVGMTFIEALQKQAEQAKNFAIKVQELIQMGLSREAITMVLQAGIEAGTNIANELITGGATTIQETNELVDTTKAAADEVGLLAAENFMQAGIDSAKQTLSGFREQFGKGGPAYRRLQEIMDNLAASMKRDTTITITTIHRDVFETVGAPAPPRRAMGGPVFSDRPYMVGEFGPEIFVPNGVSGTIVPADRVGDANQTINVYAQTNANAHDISREIAWTLKVGV